MIQANGPCGFSSTGVGEFANGLVGGTAVDSWMKWLIGIGSVLTALIFFWPTPYRYEDGGLVRINRLTGYAEKAGGTGWVPADKAVEPVHDSLTPEIEKQFGALEVTSQDFDSITLKNSTPWSFVVIENSEVGFDPACGVSSDYVTFVTADRSIPAGTEVWVVKTLLARDASRPSAKVSESDSISTRIRSSARKAEWPSFMW